MKTLIQKGNFKLPYPSLSLNTDESKIVPSIWRSQNENLRGVVGESFYEAFMGVYETEKTILGVVFGSQTVITLQNSAGLEVGYFASFRSVTGTISEVLNGKEFQITAIFGNEITINANSIGKTFLGGGILERVLSPFNRILYGYIEPYLIYSSLADYVPFSSVKDTNSGYMAHQLGEANAPSDKQLGIIANGYRDSAKSYATRLVSFAKENAVNYPLFAFANNAPEFSAVPVTFKRGNNYDQGSMT